MAKASSAPQIGKSVLDRLIDDDPDTTRDAPSSPAGQQRQLRAAIVRDVQNLLTTRCRCTTCPDDLEELPRSLANYGVPDFSGDALGTDLGRRSILRQIEDRIGMFEPRLANVRIVPLASAGYADRTLRFRVEGTLQGGATRESISLGSAMNRASGECLVEEVG